jgi:hypothetical protein
MTVPEILKAAEGNDLALVKHLVSQGHALHVELKETVFDTDQTYERVTNSVIRSAVIHDNIEMLQYCCEYGVGVHHGYISKAVIVGAINCFKYFVTHGFDWDFLACRNMSLKHGHVELFDWIVSDEAHQWISQRWRMYRKLSSDLIGWVIESGSAAMQTTRHVINVLSTKAPDILEMSKLDASVLTHVCYNGDTELAQFLLSLGFGFNKKTILAALRSNHFECFELLFKYSGLHSPENKFWDCDFNGDRESRMWVNQEYENVQKCLSKIDLDTELWRGVFHVDLSKNPIVYNMVQAKLRELETAKQVCRKVVPTYIHMDIAVNNVVTYM